jgi:hypothetical protein
VIDFLQQKSSNQGKECMKKNDQRIKIDKKLEKFSQKILLLT